MTQPSPTGESLRTLDDASLRQWLFRARDALGRHRERLDALNVYPVPDGDTGTNLHLTLEAGLEGFVDALLQQARSPHPEPLGIVAGVAALARATLLAARGNSGVILSQLVAGLASAVATHPRVDADGVDGPVLADALAEADRYARRAVAEPVEGTILTVIRAAADAARDRVDSGVTELDAVVSAARGAAETALAATPSQLDALARAGVVDAGGAGLLLVLDALGSVVSGTPLIDEESVGAAPTPSSAHTAGAAVTEPVYEVMFLLDRISETDATALRRDLTRLGDSVLVAGDERLRTVHVHTVDAGAVVEAGIAVGRPYGLRITVLPGDAAVAGSTRDDHQHAPLHDDHAHDGHAHDGHAHGEHAHGQFVHDEVPHQHSHDEVARHDDELTQAEPAGDERAHRVADSPPGSSSGEAAVGVVACVQAPGLRRLFEEEGAVVVDDAPGRRVTLAQILAAARSAGARRVVLLPDDADALLVSGAAARVAAEEGMDLTVVPTRHVLQGLAALAVHDPDEPGCVESMREAAAGVRCATVATATSAADTALGRCEPGDVLGFVDDEVVHIGGSVGAVARAVVDLLRTPHSEIVTLVEGRDTVGLGAEVADSAELDDLEVCVLDGGQAVYDLFVGVE